MSQFDFTPIVDAISLITTTNEQNVIATSRLESLLPEEQKALHISPYSVPKKLVPYLTSKGVPYSNAASKPNPHPAHKNLERFLLQNLRHYINEPTTIISMKQEKYMHIAREAATRQIPVHLVNPVITAKDTFRYKDSMPTRFEQIRNLTTGFVVMHDALHFLTPEDIDRFFVRNPNVHSLLATHFCPVELLENSKTNSLEPGLYTLSYPTEDTFLYTPEGDSAGAYLQETANSKRWLQTFRHEGANSFNVALIDRIYAQHLFLITKREYKHEEVRSFVFPRFTRLTNFFDPRYHTLSQNFIEREILQKAILYVLGQPKAKVEDLVATMQIQLSKTGSQCGLDALLHCVAIANDVRQYEITPNLLSDAYENLNDRSKFWRDIPNKFLKFFDYERENLSKKINLQPYCITVVNDQMGSAALPYNGNLLGKGSKLNVLSSLEKLYGTSILQLLNNPYQPKHREHIDTLLSTFNKSMAECSLLSRQLQEADLYSGFVLKFTKDKNYVGTFKLYQHGFSFTAEDLDLLVLPDLLHSDIEAILNIRVRYDDFSMQDPVKIQTLEPADFKKFDNFADLLEEDEEALGKDKNFIRNLPTEADLVHPHPLKLNSLAVYNRLMNTPLTPYPLQHDDCCLLEALATALKVPTVYMWHVLMAKHQEEKKKYRRHELGMSYAYEGSIIAHALGFGLTVVKEDKWLNVCDSGHLTHFVQLRLEDGHFTCDLELTKHQFE